MLIVLHYGVLPSHSEGNKYSILTQECIRFVGYFTLLTFLFVDIIRLVNSKLIKASIGVICALIFALLGLMLKEYIAVSEEFCSSLFWTLIRATHILISLCLVVIAVLITKKTYQALDSLSTFVKYKVKKDLIKLWVVIIMNIIEAVVHGSLDVYLLILYPESCYHISDSDVANAIFWLTLRMLSTNAWIWPTLFAFNSRDVVKYQTRSPSLMSSVDVDEYEDSIKPIPRETVSPININVTRAYNLNGSGVTTSSSSEFDVNVRPALKTTIVFKQRDSESQESEKLDSD